MKVCMPTKSGEGMDAQISGHFGRSPTFTIYDIDDDDVQTIENYSDHMGGDKKPPQILNEHGIDVLICSNLGRRAVDRFDQLGIEVYVDANGTVRDAIEEWKNEGLSKASRDEVCEGDH